MSSTHSRPFWAPGALLPLLLLFACTDSVVPENSVLPERDPPPQVISDLTSGSFPTHTSVELILSLPLEPFASYEIRLSTREFPPENWEDLILAQITSIQDFGSWLKVQVGGLTPGTSHFFIAGFRDEENLPLGISNTHKAATTPEAPYEVDQIWNQDNIAPDFFPRFLAATGDHVYISDVRAGIYKLDLNGNIVDTWPTESAPSMLDADDGELIIGKGDYASNELAIYSLDGKLIRTLESLPLFEQISVRGTSIYASRENHVYELDRATGAVLTQFSPSKGVMDVAAVNPGDVWVLVRALGIVGDDTHVVTRYLKGTPDNAWGVEGIAPGNFIVTRGLAADNQGNLFIVEWKPRRIQKLDASGRVLSVWTEREQGAWGSVSDLAVGDDGSVYLVDSASKAVVKYQPAVIQ